MKQTCGRCRAAIPVADARFCLKCGAPLITEILKQPTVTEVVRTRARCCQTRSDFVISLRRDRDIWLVLSARLPQRRNEGHALQSDWVRGRWQIAPWYSGCPFCRAKSITTARNHCGGELICLQESALRQSHEIICPWCGLKARLRETTDEFELRGLRDREN
jgi:hypothetical protein